MTNVELLLFIYSIIVTLFVFVLLFMIDFLMEEYINEK